LHSIAAKQLRELLAKDVLHLLLQRRRQLRLVRGHLLVELLQLLDLVLREIARELVANVDFVVLHFAPVEDVLGSRVARAERRLRRRLRHRRVSAPVVRAHVVHLHRHHAAHRAHSSHALHASIAIAPALLLTPVHRLLPALSDHLAHLLLELRQLLLVRGQLLLLVLRQVLLEEPIDVQLIPGDDAAEIAADRAQAESGESLRRVSRAKR